MHTSGATDSSNRMETTADELMRARISGSRYRALGAEEEAALSPHSQQLGGQQPKIVLTEDPPPPAPPAELRLDNDGNSSVSSTVFQGSRHAHADGTDHIASDQSHAEGFAEPRQDARSQPADEHRQLNLDYSQPLTSEDSAREGCLQDVWCDLDISLFHEEEPPLWSPTSAKAQIRRAYNRDAIAQQKTLAGTEPRTCHRAVDGDLAAEPPARRADHGQGSSVQPNVDTPSFAESPLVASKNDLSIPASRLSADLEVTSAGRMSAADPAQDHDLDAMQGKKISLEQLTSWPLASELPSVGAPNSTRPEANPRTGYNSISLPSSHALNDAPHSDTTRGEESLDKEVISRAEALPYPKTLPVAPSLAEPSLAEATVGPSSSTAGSLQAVQANPAKEIPVDLPGLQTTQSQDDVDGSNWNQCKANRESNQNECGAPQLASPQEATANQIEQLEAPYHVEAPQESITAHSSEMFVEAIVSNSGPASRKTASRQTNDYPQTNAEQVEAAQDASSIAVTHQEPQMRISHSSLSLPISGLSSPKKAVLVRALSPCLAATISQLLSERGDNSCAEMAERGAEVSFLMQSNGASSIADGGSMDGKPRAQTLEIEAMSNPKHLLEFYINLHAQTHSSNPAMSEVASKEVDEPLTLERVSGSRRLSAAFVNGQKGRRNAALKAEKPMRKRRLSLKVLKKRKRPREKQYRG